MKKARFSEEKIIATIKQLEGGRPAKEVARELGVSDQTLYNWKSKYGGMEVNEARRLKSLENENRRLKEMVADLSLDREALKAVIRKNGGACERPAGRGIRDGGIQHHRTPRLQAPRPGPFHTPVRRATGP
jgi:putative transposase